MLTIQTGRACQSCTGLDSWSKALQPGGQGEKEKAENEKKGNKEKIKEVNKENGNKKDIYKL